VTLWLSSFPRSGNTLFRQILFAGWGLSSGSVYHRDLGDNLALIRASGHVDLRLVNGPHGIEALNPHNLPIKTHDLPPHRAARAIHVVRDGRAACVSLWHFTNRALPLADIVCGRTRFGTWSDHVMAWLAVEGLLAVVRYEDMIARIETVTAALVPIFGPPRGDPAEALRNRAALAEAEGTWVRPASDWREHWSDACEELFRHHNAPALERLAGARAPALPEPVLALSA